MAQKKRKEPFVVAARSFRPQRFEDVIGQEHVTRVLQNAIRTDRVAHAYLFCGPRGVGKTTTARVLAKALNCQSADKPTPDPCQKCAACDAITRGTSVDVIEIDGASNRGIDEVRELRANARLQPAMGRFRIYYIDEVHMLTREAFNALLKILEEPPPHLRFIMSTTEEHKVPETILSRCQTYRFRLMNTQSVVEHLRRVVSSQRKEKVEEEVYFHIARAAAGSMRDALSLLEQVLALKTGAVTFQDAELVLGTVEREVLVKLVDALHSGRMADILQTADEAARGGKDLAQFVRDLIDHYRDLLVIESLAKPDESLMLSPEEMERVREQAKDLSDGEILRAVEILWEAENRMRYLADPRIVLEVALVKIARLGRTVEVESLLERLTALEEALSGGGSGAGRFHAPSGPEAGPREESSLFGKGEPAGAPPGAAGAPPGAAGAPPAAAGAPPASRGKEGAGGRRTGATAPPGVAGAPPAMAGCSRRAGDGNGLLERAVREWDRIVGAVREESPRVAGCLQGAVPVAIKGTTLVVGVPHRNRYQHTALAQPASAKLLQTTIERILGPGYGVRCEPYEFEGETEEKPGTASDESPDIEKLKEEEPMLGPLLELFNGRVVAVRASRTEEKNGIAEEGD